MRRNGLFHVAKAHAEQMGLDIDYRFATAEQLLAQGEQFDAVLNMEVVEHVADVQAFISVSADLVKPGGCMFMATLNRTAKILHVCHCWCGICDALAASGHP